MSKEPREFWVSIQEVPNREYKLLSVNDCEPEYKNEMETIVRVIERAAYDQSQATIAEKDKRIQELEDVLEDAKSAIEHPDAVMTVTKEPLREVILRCINQTLESGGGE